MVDVIMRVPPLFVIDEILKISMGLQTNLIDTAAAGMAGGSAASTTADTITKAGNGLADLLASVPIVDALNGTAASAAAAAGVIDMDAGNADAAEFYKVLSWTTLKIATCLIGELLTLNARAIEWFFFTVVVFFFLCAALMR